MLHGYVRGHELLATSVKVSAPDQDEITRLSDLSGNLLGNDPPSYLTLYPVPSGRYYAVARTWPDAQAARRGCVITRTALVPMEAWRNGVPVEPLVDALRPVDRAKLEGFDTGLIVDWDTPIDVKPLAASLDMAIPDFVNRAFLKPRSPIIWPISTESLEDVERLSLRLVSFLWPSRRTSTSLCTYALQPRQIGGKPFELMFAPAQAISRFRAPSENVIGQPVVSVPNDQRAEHVNRTLRQVLNGKRIEGFWPSFSAFAGVLPDQSDALLRLATLDDLSRRGASVPKALVAALDVWASLAPNGGVAQVEKNAATLQAVERSRTLPMAEALELLASLLQRLVRLPFRTLAPARKIVRQEIASRSSVDLRSAFRWLTESRIWTKNLAGIVAHGALEVRGSDLDALDLLEDHPDLMAAVLRAAPDLPRRYVVNSESRFALDRIRKAEKWVGHLGPQDSPRVVRRLVQADQIILSQDFMRLAIDSVTGPELTRLLAAPTSEIAPDVAWTELQKMSARFPEETRSHYLSAERYVPQEFRVFASSIGEADIVGALKHVDAVGAREAGWLAMEYLHVRQPAKAALQIFALLGGQDRAILQALWKSLLSGFSEASKPALDFVRQLDPATVSAVISPTDIQRSLPDDVRLEVVSKLAIYAMSTFLTSNVPITTTLSWIDAAQTTGGADRIDKSVDDALSQHGSTAPVERVWELTEARLRLRPPPTARKYLALVERAIALTKSRYNRESVAVWARLVLQALDLGPEYRELVGIGSFEAAFRARRAPVSPVIVATFPVLHAGLPGKKRATMFIGLLPIPYEMDKKKDARRELVDAFLESSWPPGDLAMAAHRAGVLSKIVARLQNLRKGDYVQRMIGDLGSRPEPLAKQLVAHIRQAKDVSDD